MHRKATFIRIKQVTRVRRYLNRCAKDVPTAFALANEANAQPSCKYTWEIISPTTFEAGASTPTAA